MSNLEFRQLLIDISDGMSDDERQRFVFLLGDDIPRRIKDDSLLAIFQALIERGRISADNCTYLETIFIRLKLNKIIQKITRYTEGQTTTTFLPSVLNVNSSSNENQRIFNEILRDMDDDSIKTSSENQRTVTKTPISWAKNDLKIFENEFWSDEFLQKIDVSTRPYEYQRELVQHAIQSKNTIICFHSDSDKLFILNLLLKYYSMKHQDILFDSKRKFLAFICVSRSILLKQQAERLNEVKNLRIIACGENIDLMNSTKNYDVILCTPQKLLNALETNLTLISSIDLLCFDECFDHHAYHRYVDIMKYVLCQGIYPYPPSNHLPIIIGLTATIDRRTFKIFGKDTPNILKKLVTFCAQFNCSTITTISNEKYFDELKTNLHPTFETEICCVEKNSKFEKILTKVEKDFQNLINDLFSDPKTNRSKIIPEKDLDDNGYEQDLQLLKQSAEKNDDSNTSILLNYVLIIYPYRKWLKDFTPNLIITHLKNQLRDRYQIRVHPTEIDTFIYEKIEHFPFSSEKYETISNPKLEKLVEILLKNVNQPTNRGFPHYSSLIRCRSVCLALVLVESAFHVERLVEFFQSHSQCKEIIRPCSFTKSKQIDERILNDFQNCFVNVLVSTNRSHAGLILPECSMIIRYEFVPDRVETIPTGRRGHVTKGKEILLTTQNSLNYQKEENNREDDRSFERLIDEWKRTSPEEFADRVENEKISLIEEWKKDLRKCANQRSVSNDGEILCRSCGYFLGSLSDLRIVDTYYFVNDPKFYNRIEEQLDKEPGEYKKERKMGYALCGNKSCRSEIGRYVILKLKRKTRPIYPLRCRSVKIRQNHSDKDEKSMLMKTQWKLMPFYIPPLVDDEGETDDEDFFYDATDS